MYPSRLILPLEEFRYHVAMKRFALLGLIVLVVALGCKEKEEPLAEPPSGEQTSAQPSGGGSNDIGIVSPAAGTSSPVTNPGAVQGSGGGSVGAAAKGQAHKAAEKAGGTSLNQLDDQ